jgi:hypothetical protein
MTYHLLQLINNAHSRPPSHKTKRPPLNVRPAHLSTDKPNDVAPESSSRTRIGFDDLPDELKVHILKYALITDETITAKSYRNPEGCLNIYALLLTNKRTHTLAAQVYYGSNTFIIERKDVGYEEPWCGTRDRFRYPPFAFGLWVRKLELRLSVGTRADSTRQLLQPCESIYAPNEWLTLLRPWEAVFVGYDVAGNRVESRQASHAHWQTHFPKLDALKVRITGDTRLSADEKQVFHDIPRHATIDLRPKSFRVETVQRENDPLRRSSLRRYLGQRLHPISMAPDKVSQDTISHALGEMMILQADETS